MKRQNCRSLRRPTRDATDQKTNGDSEVQNDVVSPAEGKVGKDRSLEDGQKLDEIR